MYEVDRLTYVLFAAKQPDRFNKTRFNKIAT